MLIFAGHHHGNFVLSMIFGTLFLVDGLLQCISAWIVRYRRWKIAFSWGVVEILLAIFFYQPYPTHYVGTLPYCLGLFLFFGGLNLITLAARVRRLAVNPALDTSRQSAPRPDQDESSASRIFTESGWEGPPGDDEPALTVHVWTPTGSSRAPRATSSGCRSIHWRPSMRMGLSRRDMRRWNRPKASTSASTLASKSTDHPTSSDESCARRKKTTCRECFSPTTRPNRMRGARQRCACVFATMIPRNYKRSGNAIGQIRPTT